MQKAIKEQFVTDNKDYMSNLLSQKDQERFYLAKRKETVNKLHGKIGEKPVVNLSELIRKNLERHRNINRAMPHSKMMEKANTLTPHEVEEV
jgi:hypothetical protein